MLYSAPELSDCVKSRNSISSHTIIVARYMITTIYSLAAKGTFLAGKRTQIDSLGEPAPGHMPPAIPRSGETPNNIQKTNLIVFEQAVDIVYASDELFYKIGLHKTSII